MAAVHEELAQKLATWQPLFADVPDVGDARESHVLEFARHGLTALPHHGSIELENGWGEGQFRGVELFSDE